MANPNPKGRHTIERRRRMAKALDLRTAGLSVRAIGEQLGVSHTQAANDINDALDAVIIEPAHNLIKLETAKADSIFAKAYRQLMTNDDIRAGELALKAQERKARMHNLDNPAATELTGTVSTLITQLIGDPPPADTEDTPDETKPSTDLVKTNPQPEEPA